MPPSTSIGAPSAAPVALSGIWQAGHLIADPLDWSVLVVPGSPAICLLPALRPQKDVCPHDPEFRASHCSAQSSC